MPHLVILNGPHHGLRFVLDRPRTLVGRDQDCHIVLDAHDTVHGKTAAVVSRRHAVITCDKGAYFVEDGDGHGRASRNGTMVNSERLPTGIRTPLKNRDSIKICDFTLIFHDELAPVPLPPEPDSPSSIEAVASADSSSVYLAQSAEKLQRLLEITNHLCTSLDLDTLLPEVVENLLQLFKQADRGFMIFVDDTNGALLPQIVKTRRPEDESRMGFSATIVRECLKRMEGLLSNDADERYKDSDSVAGLALRSVMCAPLRSQEGKALGVLLLDSRHAKNKFDEGDLNFLMAVANQASIALANARYHRDALARERLNRDMALARVVQRMFLPADVPSLPGYEFFARNESALEVGGDYYDFVELGPRGLAILLGDVTGKGVAAALVMARFSAEARACLRTEPDLTAAIRQLNSLMQPLSRTDRFVTLAAVLLDPATHRIALVNAGHPSPLLVRRDGAVEEITPLDEVGPPLGVLDGYAYVAHLAALEPGDRLILFSDGVTEALDRRGRQLGVQGLRALLDRAERRSTDLGEQILQAVDDHSAGCDQHDDITLVCLGRM